MDRGFEMLCGVPLCVFYVWMWCNAIHHVVKGCKLVFRVMKYMCVFGEATTNGRVLMCIMWVETRCDVCVNKNNACGLHLQAYVWCCWSWCLGLLEYVCR